MFCPECGNINNELAAYCGSCGAELKSVETGGNQRRNGFSPPAYSNEQIDISNKVCTSCGTENSAGWKFCKSCGAQLAAVKRTIVLPLSLGSAEDSRITSPPKPYSKNFTNRIWFIGGMVVAIIALVTGYYLIFINHDTNVNPKPVSPTVTNSNTSTHSQTSTHQEDDGPSEFITEFEPLVKENAELETQIIELADEINKVAPKGITSAMISKASDLERQLNKVKADAEDIYPIPPGFSSSYTDFSKLIDYNITRSDALYRGAIAWSKNQSNYEDIFEEGHRAKDAYMTLLPIFDREYDMAKTGA